LFLQKGRKNEAIWREYIQFSISREKWVNARIIYSRAVLAVDNPASLLQDFVAFEISRGNTDATLASVMAYSKQREASVAASTKGNTDAEMLEPATKKPRTDDPVTDSVFAQRKPPQETAMLLL
jgi:predicted ThiF/HesA family dinucleotide-utilizing enzyme